MNRYLLLLGTLLSISGCATQKVEEIHSPEHAVLDTVQVAGKPALFSVSRPGAHPPGWSPMVIFKNKKQTDYKLVAEQEAIVLHAYSANASSGLMQKVNIDPLGQPWLHWQWKIGELSDKLLQAHDLMEDVPVRIILGFDGDKESLPFSEQILFETARLITGHDFPYATLMYEWHIRDEVETIRHSKRSSRIRKIVVQNGEDAVGKWNAFSRNIVEDYEKAYGEKPGRLIGIGVLTDSDFAGETIEAWYGDIRLLSIRN